ncbi:MAG: hypothetical protein KY469_01385 [Actinobacteria bacterium]|nr:hypothetical protein [Actinomycetota bacterium]
MMIGRIKGGVAMRPTSPILLYIGLAVTAAGFALIAMTWGRVAPLDSVALQLPYLVSGGLTGLGLIIVGAVMLNVHAKRREAAQRERQTQQLLEILRRLSPETDDGSVPEAADATEPEDPSGTEELAWRR